MGRNRSQDGQRPCLRAFLKAALPLALLWAMAFLHGCSGPGNSASLSRGAMPPVSAAQGVARIHALPTLFNLAEGLVYQLEENARQGSLSGMPLVVTSSVSIDNLAETSRFGRLLGEAIGSELFRRGADVRDIRNTGSLQVMPLEGEMALSRQAQMLAKEVDAQAVVVGTYGLTDASVVVNIRMLDIATGRIFSVAMSEIARTSTIESMLHPEGFSAGGELGGPTTFDRLQE